MHARAKELLEKSESHLSLYTEAHLKLRSAALAESETKQAGLTVEIGYFAADLIKSAAGHNTAILQIKQ